MRALIQLVTIIVCFMPLFASAEADCRNAGDKMARAKVEITAGWALVGLGNIVDKLAQTNPNVAINAQWSYGLLGRKVLLTMEGTCNDVKAAYDLIGTLKD